MVVGAFAAGRVDSNQIKRDERSSRSNERIRTTPPCTSRHALSILAFCLALGCSPPQADLPLPWLKRASPITAEGETLVFGIAQVSVPGTCGTFDQTDVVFNNTLDVRHAECLSNSADARIALVTTGEDQIWTIDLKVDSVGTGTEDRPAFSYAFFEFEDTFTVSPPEAVATSALYFRIEASGFIQESNGFGNRDFGSSYGLIRAWALFRTETWFS